MSADNMKSLTRLNYWLHHCPLPLKQRTTPLSLRDIAIGISSTVSDDKMPSPDDRFFSRMACGSSMFCGFPKVAYQFDFELFFELSNKSIDSLSMPAKIFRLPHKRMFIGTYTGGKLFEFFIGEEHLDDGGRLITFISHDSVSCFPLYDGITIGESIESIFTALKDHPRLEELKYDLQIALNICLFMTGGDVVESTIQGKTGKKARNLNQWEKRESIVGEVGGQFLSTLRRYKEKLDTEYASKPHGSPRPHIRAGHWHLYWTGKGRTNPKVKFLHPCLVNADSVGDVEIIRTIAV